MARLIRRSGSMLACIINTVWAKAPEPAIIFTIARPARRNGLRRSTNIRREAPASFKAWALIEQSYDGSYNGDAYGSVMYQNENVSVRVSDEFMEAALEGREWWTRRVLDGQPCERKDARTLLRKIAEGTHICGDPGMQ